MDVWLIDYDGWDNTSHHGVWDEINSIFMYENGKFDSELAKDLSPVEYTDTIEWKGENVTRRWYKGHLEKTFPWETQTPYPANISLRFRGVDAGLEPTCWPMNTQTPVYKNTDDPWIPYVNSEMAPNSNTIVTLAQVEVKIENDLPGTSADGKICLNAQEEYRTADVSIEINGINGELDHLQVILVLDSTEHAHFLSGNGNPVNWVPIRASDPPATLVGVSPGEFTITPILPVWNQCGPSKSSVVFKIILNSDTIDSSATSTGHASFDTSTYIIEHDADSQLLHCAADMNIQKYVWFETTPPNCYSGPIKAGLKITQTFTNRERTKRNCLWFDKATYGIYIFNCDCFPLPFNMQLDFGIVKFPNPLVPQASDWAGYSIRTIVETPDDTEYCAPNRPEDDQPDSANITICSDIMNWDEEHLWVVLPPNHMIETSNNHIYHLGTNPAKASVKSRASTSGAFRGSHTWHDSWGYVYFGCTEIPPLNVEIKGDGTVQLVNDP